MTKKPTRKPVSKAAAKATNKITAKKIAKAKPKTAKVTKAPASLHDTRFPGESRAYRTARNKLLAAEIDLRRRVEAVAAMRRKLPTGGEIPEDYVFEEGSTDLADRVGVRKVKMSELFARDGASLFAYSFMFGPKMERPCPACTSILDALNGTAPHLTQRINFVVIASSPIERIREFARERGWTRLRLLSSAGNSFNRDYHAESATGSQLPAAHVFVKDRGKVRHFSTSELLYAPADPGQNARHVDMLWPLWNVFDLTPEGRGKDFHPRLAYPA